MFSCFKVQAAKLETNILDWTQFIEGVEPLEETKIIGRCYQEDFLAFVALNRIRQNF